MISSTLPKPKRLHAQKISNQSVTKSPEKSPRQNASMAEKSIERERKSAGMTAKGKMNQMCLTIYFQCS